MFTGAVSKEQTCRGNSNLTRGHIFIKCSPSAEQPPSPANPAREIENLGMNGKCVQTPVTPGRGLQGELGICTQFSEDISYFTGIHDRIQSSLPLYTQRCSFLVSEGPILNNQYSNGLLKPLETKHDLRMFLIVALAPGSTQTKNVFNC